MVENRADRVTAPFVGRALELSALDDAWRAVQAGGRRAVLIGGEPGAGKTSVTMNFAGSAGRMGATVLVGRSDENLDLPYQPFAEAIRAALDAGAIHEIRTLPGAGELARLVPDLAARVPDLDVPLSADPGAERWALFEAVVHFFGRLSRTQPLVLVLDDLQWASASTVELLRYLLRSERAMRVLVVAAFREAEASDSVRQLLADLRSDPWATRLTLRGLDAVDIRALVASIVGGVLGPATDELALALHRATNGNPFFVIELVHHLVETHADFEGRGEFASRLAVDDLGLPESVRDVVSHRVARLRDETYRALSIGALVGQSFSVAMLDAVRSVALDTDALLDALEEAVDMGLIAETKDGFEFCHAIVRNALADGFGSARRIRLHREIGEALEMQPGYDRHLEAIVHHFAAAAPLGDGVRAARWAVAAGRQARDRTAYELAIDVFERGLASLEYDAHVDVAVRGELLIELADTRARLSSRESEEVRAAIARAAEDAKAAKSARLLTTAVTVSGWYAGVAQPDPEHEALIEDALTMIGAGDDDLRAEVLAAKAFHIGTAAGRIDEALELSSQAADLARRTGSDLALTRALHARASALLSTPRIDELGAIGVELMAREHDRSGPYTRSFALTFQATAALMAGDRNRFEQLHRDVSTLASETRAWYAQYTDVAYRGNAALMDGRWDDALAADEALIGLAGTDPNALNVWAVHQIAYHWDTGRMAEFLPAVEIALDTNPGVYGYRTALAMAYGEIGRLDEAREILGPLRAERFEVPRDQTWPAAVAVGIDAVARTRDAEAAAMLYSMLADYQGLLLASVGAMFNVGAADRFLGMAAAVTGRFDQATRHFEAAVAIEDTARCRPQATRTRLWFGRMLLERGDARRAEQVLGRAQTDAEALGMAGVAAEARELRSG